MKQMFFYISSFFLVFLISSCKNESINFPEMLTHSQWQALNIENYEFEQRVVCFCTPPAGRFHKITVESGAPYRNYRPAGRQSFTERQL